MPHLRTRQPHNLSPLDKVQRLLPFKGRLSRILNCLTVMGGLYLGQVAIVYSVGEQSELFRDYAVPSLIVLVGYFLFMEPYIGDQIRKSAAELKAAFPRVEVPEYLEMIFDNRLR